MGREGLATDAANAYPVFVPHFPRPNYFIRDRRSLPVRVADRILVGRHRTHEHFNPESEFFMAELQTPPLLVLRYFANLRSRRFRSRLSTDPTRGFGYSRLRCRGSMDGGVYRLRELHGGVSLSEMPPRILSQMVVSKSAGAPLCALRPSQVE